MINLKVGYVASMVIISFVTLSLIFWTNEHSFFKAAQPYQDGMSHIEAAKLIIGQKSRMKMRKIREKMEPRIPNYCIAIPTIKRRENPQYLTRNIASLLKYIPKKQWADIHLVIMHMQTEEFEELDFLKEVVRVVPKPQDIFRDYRWWAQLEAVDYTFALEYCYKIGSPNILIVEDDSELEFNVFERLNETIAELNAGPQWIWLKMFLIPKLLNWNHRDIHEALLLSGMISIVICSVLCSWIFIIHDQIFDWKQRIGVFVFVTLYITLCMAVIGKQNTMVHHGHFEHYEPVSAVAQLYPREVVPMIIDTVRKSDFPLEERSIGIDFRLGTMASDHNLKKYLLYPFPFKHTGKFSSKV
jgi:hypothetical protein